MVNLDFLKTASQLEDNNCLTNMGALHTIICKTNSEKPGESLWNLKTLLLTHIREAKGTIIFLYFTSFLDLEGFCIAKCAADLSAGKQNIY